MQHYNLISFDIQAPLPRRWRFHSHILLFMWKTICAVKLVSIYVNIGTGCPTFTVNKDVSIECRSKFNKIFLSDKIQVSSGGRIRTKTANKKVFLRERKRHTVRRVASSRYAPPPPPAVNRMGYPPPGQDLGWGTPPLSAR